MTSHEYFISIKKFAVCFVFHVEPRRRETFDFKYIFISTNFSMKSNKTLHIKLMCLFNKSCYIVKLRVTLDHYNFFQTLKIRLWKLRSHFRVLPRCRLCCAPSWTWCSSGSRRREPLLRSSSSTRSSRCLDPLRVSSPSWDTTATADPRLPTCFFGHWKHTHDTPFRVALPSPCQDNPTARWHATNTYNRDVD